MPALRIFLPHNRSTVPFQLLPQLLPTLKFDSRVVHTMFHQNGRLFDDLVARGAVQVQDRPRVLQAPSRERHPARNPDERSQPLRSLIPLREAQIQQRVHVCGTPLANPHKHDLVVPTAQLGSLVRNESPDPLDALPQSRRLDLLPQLEVEVVPHVKPLAHTARAPRSLARLEARRGKDPAEGGEDPHGTLPVGVGPGVVFDGFLEVAGIVASPVEEDDGVRVRLSGLWADDVVPGLALFGEPSALPVHVHGEELLESTWSRAVK